MTTPAASDDRTDERYKYFNTPGDFSSVEQLDYSTINGRTYETFYDGSTRTFTTTSPVGAPRPRRSTCWVGSPHSVATGRHQLRIRCAGPVEKT